MKRSPLFFSVSLAAIGTAGCVSPVGAVRQAAASAPEWYQEARVEIRGEGYPDLTRVVALEQNASGPGQVAATRVAVADAEALLLDEIGEAPTQADLDAALAWAASEQAAFSDVAPGDFLTDKDLQDLRAVFDVSRARP